MSASTGKRAAIPSLEGIDPQLAAALAAIKQNLDIHAGQQQNVAALAALDALASSATSTEQLAAINTLIAQSNGILERLQGPSKSSAARAAKQVPYTMQAVTLEPAPAPPVVTPAPTPAPPPPPAPAPASAPQLLVYTEQFQRPEWALGVTPVVETDVSADINGEMTVDEVTIDSTSSVYVRQHYNAAVPGQQYTLSAWVQQGRTGSAAKIRLTTNNADAWNTGASVKVTLTGTLTRISVPWTHTGSTVAALMIGAMDEHGAVDAECLGKVRIFGAMLNIGSTPGTYTRHPASESGEGAPTIATAPHPDDWLQCGSTSDGYFVTDNRWGRGGITEGTGEGQFQQEVGRSLTIGPNGEVAYRTWWDWPVVEDTEVKGYPAILKGRKPGYYGPAWKPAWEKNILLPDGADTQSFAEPSGPTPGTDLPDQLPIASLRSRFKVQKNVDPTGVGHLVFDLFLQQNSAQDFGFSAASITHEIMIPIINWGNYGGHNSLPNNSNPAWFDHDVTIGGILWHVYAAKDLGVNPVTGDWDFAGPGPGGVYPGVQYNFSAGTLNGDYTNEETSAGRIGWKFIKFIPDMPLAPGIDGYYDIPLADLLNYLSTLEDSRGVPWVQGTEYLASVECGVEPVSGTGDLTVHKYRVFR